MKIEHIIKRDFSTSPFQLDKITEAIQKAMDSVGVGNAQHAQDVALSVYQKLLNRKSADQEYIPTIEEVQDIVETQLMECNFPGVAKAYILYRNKRSQDRQPDIFEKRINLKPYEYPQLYEYVPEIRKNAIIDEIVDINQLDAENMSESLSTKYGLFCGLSAAANIHVARNIAQTQKNIKVVTIICDRGDRYISKI